MFIKITPKPLSDKSYITICETKHDKTTNKNKCIILKNFGRYDKLKLIHEDPIKYVKEEFAKMGGIDMSSWVNVKLPVNVENKKHLKIRNIGYWFIEKFYRKLEIDEMLWTIKSKTKIEYDLNGIMKLLTFKRILSPRSKFSMYLTKEEMYDDVKCTKDDLYRSLDILTKNKDELLFKINNQMVKLYNRTTTNTYYDVTNYYFEIEDEDEDENGEKGLRKKGLSKENRDLPIVQMGLLIDEKGLPITYDIFPGNQTDITTLKPFMEKYKKNLNVDDFTIVADKGLNSKGNLGYIDESGKKYVVAQKVRGCGKELLNQFLETKWDEIWTDKTNFKLKVFERLRTYKKDNGEVKEIKEKVVAFWSENFARKQAYERKELMEIIKRFIDNPENTGKPHGRNIYSKYVKTTHYKDETGELIKDAKHNLSIDMEKLKEDEKLDGIYFIITNDLSLTGRQIAAKYHELWKIEESFRVIKSDFKARPVRHYLQERIDAHFFTCFLSLLLIRLLQREFPKDDESSFKPKYSVQTLTNAMKGLNVADIEGTALAVFWPTDEKTIEVLNTMTKDLKNNINVKYISFGTAFDLKKEVMK